MPRRLVTRLFAAAVVTSALVSSTAASNAQTSSEIRFVAHNRDGSAMTCDQFRVIQRNGSSDRGWNDALLKSSTLEAIAMAPIECENNTFVVRGSGAAGLTLSFAWPTERGYSMMVLDLPVGPAQFVLEDALADQSVIALRNLQKQLPTKANALPQKLIATRNRLLNIPRTQASWQLFDTVNTEQLRIYETVALSKDAWRGVTFDTLKVSAAQWTNASRAVGKGGWIRIVFDLDEPFESYLPVIEQAHRSDMKVLGQILDSSQMKRLDVAGWRKRVDSALTLLPSVDGWEVGNEANGNWLGADVVEKVRYATERAAVVQPSKPRVLTLLWNLGEDTADDSMFTWLSRLDQGTVDKLSVIGLSLYPEDHPMGTAYDRVVQTLRRRAPRARIGITELGYGNDDLGGTWWWGSPTDKVAARRSVAQLYDRASRMHRFSAGGTFWWYFLQEGDVR
jgi:hypothetical protein